MCPSGGGTDAVMGQGGPQRRFALADHLVVQGARIENGQLHVALKREVPEALKPRRIAIEAGQPRQVLTQTAQAA